MNMKKKKLFVALIILVIIVVAVFFAIKFFKEKQKYDYKIEQVTRFDYNVINSKDRYGVIDRNGNNLYEEVGK